MWSSGSSLHPPLTPEPPTIVRPEATGSELVPAASLQPLILLLPPFSSAPWGLVMLPSFPRSICSSDVCAFPACRREAQPRSRPEPGY